MNKSRTAQCAKAVSLFRGLYARVARNLGVDVSYVSRVAQGERTSKAADRALTNEYNRVVAVMRNGSSLTSKNHIVVVILQCPRCKAQQKVHIAARPGLRNASGKGISCLNCGHHFKVSIPDRIIRGPFRE